MGYIGRPCLDLSRTHLFPELIYMKRSALATNHMHMNRRSKLKGKNYILVQIRERAPLAFFSTDNAHTVIGIAYIWLGAIFLSSLYALPWKCRISSSASYYTLPYADWMWDSYQICALFLEKVVRLLQPAGVFLVLLGYGVGVNEPSEVWI